MNVKEKIEYKFLIFKAGALRLRRRRQSLRRAGEKGLNFITTSHTDGAEYGMSYLLAGKLYYNYNVRELNHTHPLGSEPGRNDLKFKTQVTDVFKNQRLRVPNFNIYHVPTKTKISY